MIFRTKIVEGAPADIDQGASLYRRAVAPSCVDVEGYLGGWFLADRSSGRTITLTAWRDDAALQEGLKALHDRVQAAPSLSDEIRAINEPGVSRTTWEIVADAPPAHQPPLIP